MRSIQESGLGLRSTKVAAIISDLLSVYEEMGQRHKAENLNEIAYDRWSKETPAQTPVLTAHPLPPAGTPSVEDIESYAKIMVTLADYRKKEAYVPKISSWMPTWSSMCGTS